MVAMAISAVAVTARAPRAIAAVGPAAARPAGAPRQAEGPIAIPVLGVAASSLKDTYEEARAGHVHHAIDILAPRGTPVIAAVDGRIVKLFTSRAGGLTIYQFDRNEQLVYYYAHLDSYAINEGVTVRQGEVLGYVGTTGNAPAETPHLHFAIERLGPEKQWWRTEPINPYPILTTPASEPPARLSASR